MKKPLLPRCLRILRAAVAHASLAPIVGCRFERNRFKNSLRKALTLQNMSDVVFRGNVFVGGSSEISTNRCGTVVFK